jgi:hypothetical protein
MRIFWKLISNLTEGDDDLWKNWRRRDSLDGGLITATEGVGGKHRINFIADAAEDRKLFFVVSFGVGGIVEGPMIAMGLAGEGGAGLIGVAANGDDGVDLAVEELVEVLGLGVGKVDAAFLEGLDGEGMDVAGGVGAGGGDFDEFAGCFAEEGFGDLGAAGIAGAEDEDERFHGARRERVMTRYCEAWGITLK